MCKLLYLIHQHNLLNFNFNHKLDLWLSNINFLFNIISLPFNSMSGEPVPADEHGYAWAKVVEQGENREGGSGRVSEGVYERKREGGRV
jgi:hypothetical protein